MLIPQRICGVKIKRVSCQGKVKTSEIALITVSFQTIKAAPKNPAGSLRYE